MRSEAIRFGENAGSETNQKHSMKKNAPYIPSLEILEARIAPATLLNHRTLSFFDIDGDAVTVTFSKPVLDQTTANNVFHFSHGGFGDSFSYQQLQAIDLTALAKATAATGADITVSAKLSTTGGGDGFADIGYINATGIDLGSISIAGDLGRIDAGSGASAKTVALKSLTVQSLGEFGISTQADGADLVSTVKGNVGSLVVKGNVREARFEVGFERMGADGNPLTDADGNPVSFGRIGKAAEWTAAIFSRARSVRCSSMGISTEEREITRPGYMRM